MFLKSLIDFLLPRLCYSCNNKLELSENDVCSICMQKYQKAGKSRIDSEYSRKFKDAGVVSEFRSLYVFEKGKEFQQLIHSLKYGRKFRAGIFLGEQTGNFFSDIITGWEINYIIPVPLHKIKKVQRGYNQSSYIAKGISRVTGIPSSEKVLYRVKNTSSQTFMNLQQREENIKNAFRIKSTELVRGKNILLVDDVITTGSTINECAKMLKNCGAHKIYAISAAVADISSQSNPEIEEIPSSGSSFFE